MDFASSSLTTTTTGAIARGNEQNGRARHSNDEPHAGGFQPLLICRTSSLGIRDFQPTESPPRVLLLFLVPNIDQFVNFHHNVIAKEDINKKGDLADTIIEECFRTSICRVRNVRR